MGKLQSVLMECITQMCEWWDSLKIQFKRDFRLCMMWKERFEWSAAPPPPTNVVLPFGCMPAVRHALHPMFPRLSRQTTSRPHPPLSSASYAHPGLGTTSCWMHQGTKMAPQLLLWHTQKKAWQAKQLLGWSRARSFWECNLATC